MDSERVERKVHERLAQERRLKSVEEWRDISQTEVARALGEPLPSYNRAETGRGGVPDDLILKAAKYYGIREAYLRYGELPRTKLPAVPEGEVKMPRPPRAASAPAAPARKQSRGGRG